MDEKNYNDTVDSSNEISKTEPLFDQNSEPELKQDGVPEFTASREPTVPERQYGEQFGYPQASSVPRYYGADIYPHTSVQDSRTTSEISYAPVPNKAKKEKKPKKYARLSSVIAVCIVAVILCGCAGFGGAFLANNLPLPSRTVNGLVKPTDPLVVYRDLNLSEITGKEDGQAMTYAEVAAMVKDSVVEINTEYTTRSSWFQYVNGGAGSGVIISDDGYIVTNAHVVMNDSSTALADTITVRLSNGAEYTASCAGFDTDTDIAVIKIEETGLTPAVCGNSDSLNVGEELVIVGNPLGELGGTVTNGIVSATEREIEVSGKMMTLIQTNAAINPGNSGGGMFDMTGRLVGIVNAKSSGTDIEGLGFAIPVNNVLSATEQLIEYGYVRGKVVIGVTFRTVEAGSFASQYNIRPGVYVEKLTEGMNDDVLQIGDRIIAVNGEEITSGSDISAKVSTCSVGDTLTFQLYRNGKLIEVVVTCHEKVPGKNSGITFGDEKSGSWYSYGGNSGYDFDDLIPFDIKDFMNGLFGK